MAVLHNKRNRNELRALVKQESKTRITLSFYRYIAIENPESWRDHLYAAWSALEVLGRIYVAQEGINAQLSIPSFNLEAFKGFLEQDEMLRGVPLKFALDDDGKSFFTLTIKAKAKLVADGLRDGEVDLTQIGKHLSAAEFNESLAEQNPIIVDMRNCYESEVGRFEGALCPPAETFREALPMTLELLKGQEDRKILLYCTGGIRCEKASAYLKVHGFKDVNLLEGGILEYVRQTREEGLDVRFKGKNFVFDERMGERVTPDILGTCHQCSKPSDRHVNCQFEFCHRLFIQCDECAQEWSGCCGTECRDVIPMSTEDRVKVGRTKQRSGARLRLQPTASKSD